MAHFDLRHRRLRAYLTTVIVAGAVSIAWAVAELTSAPPPRQWLLLAALTLLTGSFNIKVPSLSARISVSEALIFAAVMALGPAAATIIVVLDAVVVTMWLRRDNRAPIRILFNIAAGALAIWSAGHAYLWLTGAAYPTRLDELLLPAAALAVTYFIVNSFLIALAISFERGTSALALWRHNFLWLAVNYLGGASVAVIFVIYAPRLDWAVVGALVPLLVLVYLAFRTSMARLEDAHQHVAQLNELHLSTIEALAMAVDAKDQITHGHIRRVQIYTVEMAKLLGIRNQSQLQAIQAAALLHDMGKLAIPEHILNKPGRLTAAEFERIKEHADIGADLIGSIKFPYPVVPIVRHHHENWDGTGYPAGLSGPDIPLGARILSVVDCFDALTSDRPYRPSLSPEAAFEILLERRGTMYDPLVVDTFIASYEQLAPLATAGGHSENSTASEFHRAGLTVEHPFGAKKENRKSTRGMSPGWSAAVSQMLERLTCTTPARVYAFFDYDSKSDSLICWTTSGDPQQLLSGLRIRLGERITGWVGANQRASINSDAALDLRGIAGFFRPPLRSAMSVPVLLNGQFLGVLTAYSDLESAFTSLDQRQLEQEILSLGQPAEAKHKIVEVEPEGAPAAAHVRR